jgi:hypothetical protein
MMSNDRLRSSEMMDDAVEYGLEPRIEILDEDRMLAKNSRW